MGLNNHVGGHLIFDSMPRANVLIVDKAYDNDVFYKALEEYEATLCISSRRNSKVLIVYPKALYSAVNKIENLLAKLNDWRRIAIRYDYFSKLYKIYLKY